MALFIDPVNATRNLQGGFSYLAQEGARKRQMEDQFQQAIRMAQMEAQIKQQAQQQDPYYQFIQKAELASKLKAMSDLGVDISPYAGIFGGTTQSVSHGDGAQQSMNAQSRELPLEIQDDIVPETFEQNKLTGQLVPKSYFSRKAKQEAEIIKGPAEAAVGKIKLAEESLNNIDDAIKILFPDGTPKSFNREIAFGSNPIRIGNIGSPVRRDNPLDPTDDIKVEQAQNVFRKIGSSLSARQLIQTGVAARPEETEKLINQFAPNFFSNPEAAYKGLLELKDFYKNYIITSTPEKRLKESQNVDTSFGRPNILKTPTSDQIKKAREQGYTGWDSATGQFVR